MGENSHRDHVSSSDSHFSQLDKSLGEITTTIQDILNPIVFSAYKSSKSEASPGEYIKDFNGFLTNYGNCFDLASGIFTSPRPGVYEFAASVTHVNRGFHFLIIEKNNSEVFRLGDGDTSAVDGDGGDTLSFSWIMDLKQGETVRLRVSEYGEFVSDTYDPWIFNGKFIRNSVLKII